MIRLIISILALASATLAQTSADDLPGLDFNVPDFSIDVDLDISGLVEQADRVAVQCILWSPETSGLKAIVGWGWLVLYRETQPEQTDFMLSAPFEGSDIKKSVSVPIWADRGETSALEHWATGDCSLRIGRDVASGNRFESRFENGLLWPSDCDFSRGPELHQVNCIWPGTDPADAEFTFTRPGLLGSAVNDAN